MGTHLELIVTRIGAAQGPVELDYILKGDSVGVMRFDRVPLESDPAGYFQRHLHHLGGKRSTPESSEARTIGLRAAGATLFQRLLPELLREVLWEQKDEAESLEVISDELSIPWELMRFAGRRADRLAQGPFFAEQFVMTRWVTQVSRIQRLPFQRIAVVIGDQSGLHCVDDERRELGELANAGRRRIDDIPSSFSAVFSKLAAGEHDGWHFIGHGAASGVDSDLWRFDLADGTSLHPGDLSGEAWGLGEVAPLVFLNACETGQGGRTLTGAGGWASAFVQAGAGAFVGSLWEVPDRSAKRFAIAFYRAFLSGQAIGAAMRQARQAVRSDDDPTWLAYVLFAHRDAVCREVAVETREGYARPPAKPADAAVTALGSEAGESAPPSSPRDLVQPAGSASWPISPQLERLAELAASHSTARRGSGTSGQPPRVSLGGATRAPGGEHEGTTSADRHHPWSPRPGDQRLHDVDSSLLLYVPGGEYTLGADDINDWTRPVHRVHLAPFWIARHPVTNEQYGRFLAAHPGAAPPEFWQDERFNTPQQPVVGVSWEDAEAYCRWVGLALPSEAQWEAAARGTEGRTYPWGDEPPEPRHANFGGRLGATSPVDAHPHGAGPFGTLDQAGNVWEWCADSWSLTAYRQRGEGAWNPVTRGDTSMRVLRGGSWVNPGRDLRAAYRDRATARLRFNTQGFRCVLPVEGY